MQRFLLLLTALSPLLVATGVGGSLEPYYKAASDCVKFLGICESRLEKYNRLVFPPDRDTMCFVRCVGLVLELWDDRNGTHWSGHNQRFDSVTEQQIRRCIESKLAIIDSRDLCSRAYYSLRCFRKHIRNVLEVDDFVSLGYVDDKGNVGDPPTILQIAKDDALGVEGDSAQNEIKNALEDTGDALGDDGSDKAINSISVRDAVAPPRIRPDQIEFVNLDGIKKEDKVYMFSVDKAGVITSGINVGVIDDLTSDTSDISDTEKVNRDVTNFEKIDIVDVNHDSGIVVVDDYSPVPVSEIVVAGPNILPTAEIVAPVEVIQRTGFIPLTASQVIHEISKCMDECGVSTFNLCAATEPLRDITPIHCVTHCAALRTNVYCDQRGPLMDNLYLQLSRCESEQSFRRRLELCFRRRCQPPGTCPQAIAYRQFITCVQGDYERFFSSHADELAQLPIFTKFCW